MIVEEVVALLLILAIPATLGYVIGIGGMLLWDWATNRWMNR